MLFQQIPDVFKAFAMMKPDDVLRAINIYKESEFIPEILIGLTRIQVRQLQELMENIAIHKVTQVPSDEPINISDDETSVSLITISDEIVTISDDVVSDDALPSEVMEAVENLTHELEQRFVFINQHYMVLIFLFQQRITWEQSVLSNN